MISKEFNREQYLNYEDLTEIEKNLYILTELLKEITEIPSFAKKTWIINEFLWIEEVERIEQGVENLGKYFYKPQNWVLTKEWKNDSRKAVFDYNDVNRWIKNINLIYNHKDEKISIWNGISYLNWDTDSEMEWEE